jgi:hypothetical protein
MKNAITAWKWSLGVVARSYRTLVLLAVLFALWGLAAYEWLGMPAESSALLMVLSFLWAIAQLLVGAVMVGGMFASAGEVAENDARVLPLQALWKLGRKTLGTTLVFCVMSLVLIWICNSAINWIGAQSVEVASFLTFHLQKPVSHELIEIIFEGIGWLVWIIFSGFLMTMFIAVVRAGWGQAGKQMAKILASCTFRTPFLTSLISVVVFGELIYKLAVWHPIVPPGFWDYTQLILRFSLALLVLSAGLMFWLLALARLYRPKQEISQAG